MKAEKFKDFFTAQAAQYPKYRPGYPLALFKHLANLAPRHERAWDCATGSGQAALGLAPFFHEIIATDASPEQIAHATPSDRISYSVATAEKSGINSNSVDLVVVAQALHWFHFDRFYTEVERVLTAHGIIAVWCYGLFRISPAVDAIIDRFYSEIVGPFWPPERAHVDEGYRSIPFPFPELSVPDFKMEAFWNLDHLIGYLSTWSSVQKYKGQKNSDPIALISDDLIHSWGIPELERQVVWPLHVRIGTLLPESALPRSYDSFH